MKLIFTLLLVFSLASLGSVLPSGSGVRRHAPQPAWGPPGSVTSTWSLADDNYAPLPLLPFCPPGLFNVTFLQL